MTASGSTAPSTGSIIAMGVLVALLLLWSRFAQKLPSWMAHAGTLLLHGQNPQLSPSQIAALIASLVGIGLLSLLLLCGTRWVLRRLGHTAIYDMRLVAEKTGRSAYRARLRLFVIDSAEAATPGESMQEATLSGHSISFLLLRLDEIIPSCVRHTYRQWRQRSLRKRARSRTHREFLDRLTGPYRQYHTAAGGYFVARDLSPPQAQSLLVE